MSLTKPGFSVRIVVCDYYLAKPIPGIDVIYSEFRGSDIKQVPTLRIFGAAQDGYKACLHVHGVFPYFYIPCPTSNPEPQFLYQIAASLDKALNIALKQATSANQHVYRITLVKGLPFYGFHDKEHLYLKVFLYNPSLIKQAVELCSNGAILGQTFQPHESHLNFTLQFFIDFNLFGMSNIDLQTVHFRKKTNMSQNSDDPLDSPQEYAKCESICYYEADCIASHIINRQRIGRGDSIENPGLEEVWNQEKERRKQLNMSMASKSLSQGRLKAEETDSHYKFEQMMLIKLSGLVDKPVDVEESPKETVYYPAESLEGSQLFSAVDVSVHLPEYSLCSSFNTTLKPNMDETLIEDADATLVDEDIALNSTLVRYSQVSLDNEDLDFLDVLKDMDDDVVEKDSVMATPASDQENNENRESDIDEDLEYSQIFHDETIPLTQNSKDGTSECSWNDSFWDGANIPQLDGTFDDDHVKKVRKRKMRPFKLGLSRPKTKNKVKEEQGTHTDTESTYDSKDHTPRKNEESNMDIDDSSPDEINESRETVENVSSCQLRKSVKCEPNSVLDYRERGLTQESITELVQKTVDKVEYLEPHETYDRINNIKPTAGTSSHNDHVNDEAVNHDIDINDSFDSTPNNKDLGLISFYDSSKIFDVTFDNDDDCFETDEKMEKCDGVDLKKEIDEDFITEDIKLRYSDTSEEQPVINVSIKHDVNTVILTPKYRPPTFNYIEDTLENYNIPKHRHQKPFCSNYKDVGDKVEIGQMVLKVVSKLAHDQKPFERILDTTSIEEWRQLLFLQTNEIMESNAKPEQLKQLLAGNRICVITPIIKPPTTSEVRKWNKSEHNETRTNETCFDQTESVPDKDDLESSQVIGLNDDVINSSISLETEEQSKTAINDSLQVTMHPDGSFLCFGNGEPENEIPDSPVVEMNFLTTMIIELHTDVRGELNPDPSIDQIRAVFVTISNDCPSDHFLKKSITEIIVADPIPPPKYLDRCVFNSEINYVNSESNLIEMIIDLIKKHDPDIMCGYEIEMKSWGYLLERSEVLGIDVVMEISRITEKNRQKRWKREGNDYEGRIIGRIMFNVWRLFRHELALSSYSFENCMFEVLKERVPAYSYAQLSEWWEHESRMLRWIPVDYYLTRLSGTVRMLEKLDIINRTAELARIFGLQWWEVLSRGSQFRVESLMLRTARPHNLVALSPTVKQRAAMRAPECLPLIFEPESRFYCDPVIVLDFQSLYPSMMIAYNYCFSTCIGRVQNINGESAYEFGAWRLRIPKSKLQKLIHNGLVHWSPVGVGFVKSSVRRGVLPSLLRRILAARQAVKKSMKMQTDEAVKKAMHSRQLGLKLIANVTYGYTAANFSGRMPCVEVGDSVVAKGRETLQRAIDLVRNNKSWNCKVVYGDTDSMFVLVEGANRARAFEVGQEIADAVTADNPSPVALKLEKVYQPCILQTKKRYVGYMYETPDQEKPVYEAKGIETVRRDGCPAGVKLLKRALCELFETSDVSRMKKVVMETLSKMADGTLPVHELFFTREYHGPNGYRPGASAPPNEIAKRLAQRDPRSTPRPGSRVAWLVTAGAPGQPLVKLARSPQELLKEGGGRALVSYYVTRALLPPLIRCAQLLPANVTAWWDELGYTREIQHIQASTGGIGKYLWRERCALCGYRSTRSICPKCASQPLEAVAMLTERLRVATSHVEACRQICNSCTGHQYSDRCNNTECSVLWRRLTAKQKLTEVQDIVRQMPAHMKCCESLDF